MFELHYKPYNNMQEYMQIISKDHYITRYKRCGKKGYYVYNVPCAFDIETYSWTENNLKKCSMYIWQFAFNGYVFIGRTWKEFKHFISELHKTLQLNDNKRVYVYVHNLSYEFQFMRKWFEWDSVFSVDRRTPIKAETMNIEFKDSYILSGYSLAKTAEQLRYYKVKKLVGDLDYTKPRGCNTNLTENEIAYCVNDVLVVSAYIQEQIDFYKNNICYIPMTNTGKVRKFCQSYCYKGDTKDKKEQKEIGYNFSEYIHRLTLELDEYELLQRSFQGGFTHANAYYVDKEVHDVTSYDFTSSYPAVMLLEKYPSGKSFKIKFRDMKDYEEKSKQYCMIFDVEMIDVSPQIIADNPISESRCFLCENPITNNGRIVYADRIMLSCTNVDLDIYLKFYNMKHLNIYNARAYTKDYLPTNFLKAILKLYKDKTELKGVSGKEVEYLHSKGMLNSCYGMAVTNIMRDSVVYDDDWGIEEVDKESAIEEYNTKRGRFLFYPWGVFVTAYARRNLFSAIKECQNDYIYADTDSVKIVNVNSHLEYFRNYNELVQLKIQLVCKSCGLDEKDFSPITVTGKKKPIGVWDYDGHYDSFKTLGAKRYAYIQNGDLHITVAGLGKSAGKEYLLKRFGSPEGVMNHFENSLYIPPEGTGKLTHTYIDDSISGTIIDYEGVESHYEEKSYIHLGQCDFTFSRTQAFIEFLKGYRNEYRL